MPLLSGILSAKYFISKNELTIQKKSFAAKKEFKILKQC